MPRAAGVAGLLTAQCLKVLLWVHPHVRLETSDCMYTADYGCSRVSLQ